MTVMEVWKYGKPDIIFGFHNFWPFPNFLVSMENVLRKIVRFHYLLIFIISVKCIELNIFYGL